MRRLAAVLVALLLVPAAAYFAYAAIEGSHRMVDQWNHTADCRLPTDVGIGYEAVNYDIASDTELIAREPDRTECSAPGAEPGDALVTSDGVRLAGWYVPAASGIGPDGATVILDHGWTSNKSRILEALEVFHEEYNVVLFDFRNHGQSQVNQTTQGIREQLDLVAVLDWLEREKGPNWVVVWGQSMGGHVAVNVAASDERIDGLIFDSVHSRLIVPFAKRTEKLGYPFGSFVAVGGWLGAWVRTGVNVWSAEPIDAIDDLGDVPVLILYGGRDDTIPAEDAEALLAAATSAGVDARFEVCERAGHAGLITTCPEEYRAWVAEFLESVPSD